MRLKVSVLVTVMRLDAEGDSVIELVLVWVQSVTVMSCVLVIVSDSVNERKDSVLSLDAVTETE